MNLSLDKAWELVDAFGLPELPMIHVAGTNGKGSVTTKIGKAYELQGFRVGVYTSPHLFTFRERIVINGEMISEEDVREGLREIFSSGIEATYFEILTFLAFNYFSRQRVDIAVIETGLGGRLDATNVITPILSVITSISEDHMPLLGTTLDEVAAEKAGIIKPGIPVVIGPRAQYKAIMEKADELYIAKEVEGDFDDQNSEIARLALEVNGIDCPEALKARLRCRFEQVGNVIYDVAHNVDGFKALFKAMELHFPGESITAIVGMSKDKNVEKCFRVLVEHCKHIHLVEADSPRAATKEELAAILDQMNYKAYTTGTIEEGINTADRIVVCGTFFIMKDAWDYPAKDTLDLNERSLCMSSSSLISSASLNRASI